MSYLGLIFTLAMGILTISLPRKYTIMPLLVICFSIPQQYKVIIGSFDVYMIRIMIIFMWMRVIFRKDEISLSLNAVDYLVIFWGITNLILYCFSHNDPGALTNRLGFLYTTFGVYFYFRCVIRELDDIDAIRKQFAVIVIVVGLAMLYEDITGRNFYGQLWQVSWKEIQRRGELRCLGPFSSPILAGTFGATAIPFLIPLWRQPSSKHLCMAAIIGSVLIIMAASSSGPIMTLAAGLIALSLWRFRDSLKQLRWATVVGLIFLHFIMTAPVWYLMSRISGYVGGGTGWHRSELITQAIKHFDEWWLTGTDYTAHWMPYALPANPNMTDITNHYLVQGVHGGFLTMALFIAIIWYSYKRLGNALKEESFDSEKKWIIWTIGATLFAHCVTFLSVSYFDQTIIVFYLQIAFCATFKFTHNNISK